MFSLRRYLIENKYVYLFLLFCAIVGFFCGIFLASGIYEYQVPGEFQLTFWGCAAKFLIPLLITALCGLFFAGMIGIIGSVGWAAGNVDVYKRQVISYITKYNPFQWRRLTVFLLQA